MNKMHKLRRNFTIKKVYEIKIFSCNVVCGSVSKQNVIFMNLNIKVYFSYFKPDLVIQQAIYFLANESCIQCKIKIRTNEPKTRKNTEAQPKLTGSYKKSVTVTSSTETISTKIFLKKISPCNVMVSTKNGCWATMRKRMKMQVKTMKTTNLTFWLIRIYH